MASLRLQVMSPKWQTHVKVDPARPHSPGSPGAAPPPVYSNAPCLLCTWFLVLHQFENRGTLTRKQQTLELGARASSSTTFDTSVWHNSGTGALLSDVRR